MFCLVYAKRPTWQWNRHWWARPPPPLALSIASVALPITMLVDSGTNDSFTQPWSSKLLFLLCHSMTPRQSVLWIAGKLFAKVTHRTVLVTLLISNHWCLDNMKNKVKNKYPLPRMMGQSRKNLTLGLHSWVSPHPPTFTLVSRCWVSFSQAVSIIPSPTALVPEMANLTRSWFWSCQPTCLYPRWYILKYVSGDIHPN